MGNKSAKASYSSPLLGACGAALGLLFLALPPQSSKGAEILERSQPAKTSPVFSN